MKNTILALVTAAHCALPIMVLPQGTYLADPDDLNSHALVVAPGGNVGIGTTKPFPGKLLIANSNSATAFSVPDEQAPGTVAIQNLDATPGNFSLITFNEAQAGTATAGLGTWNTEHAWDSHGCHADLAFFTKKRQTSVLSERMRITSAGNVGIGTSEPTVQLDVHGQIGVFKTGVPARKLLLDYTSGVARLNLNNGSDLLAIGVEGRNTMYIGGGDVWFEANSFNVTGNASFNNYVGFGTHSPRARVDVVGDALFSGRVSCQVLELTSDRAQKGGFGVVNNLEILSSVVSLPLSTWHYTNEVGVTHIGPMAQDFKAAFNVGSDDKHIATVDADGVLFAAVQGLNQKLETALREKDARIAALESKLSRMEERLAANLRATERVLASAGAAPWHSGAPTLPGDQNMIESE